MKEAGGAARLRRGFAVQRRVIGALLIREIYSRFGRQSLGFAWVVAEPLVFAVPVLLMLLRRHARCRRQIHWALAHL